MKHYKTTFKALSLAVLSVIAVSCKDSDVYDPNHENPENPNVPFEMGNTFNFSTIQQLKLSVDYSQFTTYGPVFFRVYNKNPFVGEGDDMYLDQSIKPIFEDYTNAQGKYNAVVKMPAFAQHLYIVTGNFLVSEQLIEAEVVNGEATAVAKNSTRATRAIAPQGEDPEKAQTNDLTVLPQLSYIVTETGTKTDEMIYNEWYTPLGTWNKYSGRPSYILNPGDVDKELLFTAEEMEGLYSTVNDALDANMTCRDEYRNHPDLTLDKESQVTLTMLGGNTCWCSSLGYYYYTDENVPTKPEDLHIIMLFPNTQDGQWSKINGRSYNGNIGVQRGDAVQLMYYPHIADEGNTSEASKLFPKGTHIGFILKAHGWGMQGANYGIKGFGDNKRKYNVWGASTPGLSFCRPFGTPGENPYQIVNPNGESRSAKFAYTTDKGDKYAIVSFEDACNDEDYDDVIFALKPVNSFTPLPNVENKKTTTIGVYAYEDLWPSEGDYDMNDIVVDFKHEKMMSKKDNEKEFKIYQENFYLTTYQNYVRLTSGLALKLINQENAIPTSIKMKKIVNEEEQEVNFRQEGDIYYLTDDVTGELGTTYVLELFYTTGHKQKDQAEVQPFIFREEENNKTWEVHLPYEAPTTRVNGDYFYTEADRSIPALNIFYVNKSHYPFAFFLYEADIENFKNTILKRENESIRIDNLYGDFLKWSLSGGTKFTDWYIK